MAVTVQLGSARRIASLVGGLILAALLVFGALAYAEGNPPFGPGDRWSGVFLTNGQAYFGHFYSGPGEYAILRDVHYVLATQLQSQDPNVPSQTSLSLQRLGGEIHGPTAEMRINKDQILFVEELRADSPVVQAIANLRSGRTPAPQAPAATTPAPPAATPTRTASPSPTRSP